jgi:hypothetical protein
LEPRDFRWAGFGVGILGEPVSGGDGFLELPWTGRRSLRLFQDGTLLFRVAADAEFLGWGLDPERFLKFPWLNPVPVVEVHTSFVHLYADVVRSLKTRPSECEIRLALLNGIVDSQRLFMTKYFEKGIENVSMPQRYSVQTDPAEESVTVSVEALLATPNRVSYLIVAAFASLFDMPKELIPFVRQGAEGPEVDLEAIKAL